MNSSESKAQSVVVVDLERYRRSGPVFRARKAMGLLLPGETLLDYSMYIQEWERQREALECEPKSKIMLTSDSP